MSRSSALKLTKELYSGIHLVAITKAAPFEGNVLIKFSDGQNKSFDKIYDYSSSEFLKMCNTANTIKDNSVFDAKADLGKRLWICIKEVWADADTVNFELFDTLLYNEGASATPKVKGNPQDNKGVASGVFKEEFVNVVGDFEMPDTKGIINTIPKPNHVIIMEQREMIKNVLAGVKNPVKIIEDDFDLM